jgi:hypothetical protein
MPVVMSGRLWFAPRSAVENAGCVLPALGVDETASQIGMRLNLVGFGRGGRRLRRFVTLVRQ